ncbi:DUF6169 family protein [Chitinophagaceae bacterium LWZ2-11]
MCDSIDKRQSARKRKFDIWFSKYNNNSLIKEDRIAIINDTAIHNSILMHKQNKQLEQILFAYNDLNQKTDFK